MLLLRKAWCWTLKFSHGPFASLKEISFLFFSLHSSNFWSCIPTHYPIKLIMATLNSTRLLLRRKVAQSSLRSFHQQARLSNSHSIQHTNTKGQSNDTSRWRYGIWVGALAVSVGVLTVSQSERKLYLEAQEIPSISTTEEGAFRLDPATGQPFPLTISVPQNVFSNGSEELQLVGLGVRTVTFLSVRVYVAGLYVDEKGIEALKNSPDWKGFEASWMSNKAKEHSGEALISALLDQNITCAIRIVPVRPTDYNHLKGGLSRAIQNRAKLARKAKLLSPEADEALSNSIQELIDAFPRTTLAKGRTLDMVISPASSGKQGFLDLTLIEEGKIFGRVKAPSYAEKHFTVPRQMLLAYFADKDEISKPFKQSVAEGIEKITKGD